YRVRRSRRKPLAIVDIQAFHMPRKPARTLLCLPGVGVRPLVNARMSNSTLRILLAGAIGVFGLEAAQAQYAWDVGIHLGGANYLGEMGGVDQPRRDFVWDMKLGQTRWAVGGFARRKLNRMIS